MKYMIFTLSIIGLISCGDKKEHQHNHDHHQTTSSDSKQKIYDYKKHDPVCGMDRMDDWEFYSVYKGDTIRFCAEHCKKGFDINPEKYTLAN